MLKATLNWIALYSAVIGVLVCGCSSAQTSKKPPLTLPKTHVTGKEPEFRAAGFFVLPKATVKTPLPYLARPDGTPMDLLCFKAAKELDPWDTAHRQTLIHMSRQKAAITKAVLAWFSETIASLDIPGVHGQKWKVNIETPAILHAPRSKVRFIDGMQCLGANTGRPPKGSRPVTTLFGARIFYFESPVPIAHKSLVAMKRHFRKSRMKLKEAVSYVPARDENGNPRVNPEGKNLYTSPDGRLITKKQIPRLRDRVAYRWSLSSKTPIYFAWGELPGDAVAREFQQEKCSLYLVFNDAIPRIPECPELKEVGFGVSPGEQPDEVVVKVTTDDEVESATTAFDTRVMIQVAGRAVVWVTPQKVEEGAFLTIDSFILDPGSGSPSALTSFAKKRRRR
ncbi:MAG: hypothetical protein QNJ97_14650 [Myxococcota bacterium]|nr:hypothetical protein [Myxococcota bacterium]